MYINEIYHVELCCVVLFMFLPPPVRMNKYMSKNDPSPPPNFTRNCNVFQWLRAHPMCN